MENYSPGNLMYVLQTPSNYFLGIDFSALPNLVGKLLTLTDNKVLALVLWRGAL